MDNNTPGIPDELSPPALSPIPVNRVPPRATYLLPNSVDISDPILFAEIHRTITSSNYLLTRERRVLRAVLLNMPSNGDNALLRRMLSLDPIQFRLLAKIFEDGLLAARNFGGRPSNQATPADSDDFYFGSAGSKRSSVDDVDGCDDANSASAKRPRLMECDGAESDSRMSAPLSPVVPSDPPTPVPETASINSMGPPPSRVQLLFQALGVPHTLPDASRPERLARRGSLQDACLARQNRTCPITGRGADMFKLETAHLVPHSIAAISTADDAPYWRLLTLCIGAELTNRVFEIVGGANSFRSSNGLTMDPTLHGSLFDRGLFWLVPHLPVDFDPEASRYYDIEFIWRADQRSLSSIMTFLPQDPDAQLDRAGRLNLLDDARRMETGDRFRLFTRDPERYPLPHPLLLYLHAMLWEMVASSGLQETARARQAAPVSGPSDARRGRRGPLRARSQPRGSQTPRSAGQPPESTSLSPSPHSTSAGLGQQDAAGTGVPSSVSSLGARSASGKSVSSASSFGSLKVAPSPCLDVEYVDFKLQMHAHVAGAEEEGYPEDEEYEVDDGDADVRQERCVSPGLLVEFDEFHYKMAQRGMLEPEEGEWLD